MVAIPALIIGVLWALSGGMHIPAEGPVDFGVFFGHWDFHYLSKNVLFIDAIFVPAFFFAAYAAFRGASSMWKQMAAGLNANQEFRPSTQQFVKQFLWPSIVETIQHKRFNECGPNKNRVAGHLPLVLAFAGLFTVTGYSFIRKDIFGIFYPALHGPIAQYDPFKIIANISAIAMIVGVGILWSNRASMEEKKNVAPTFYDWFLIGEIMAVGVTGLLAELMRLLDIPVLAYLFYFMHLVSVFMLFFYMPYTKFAHMVYRTIAMAFERYRNSEFVKN
jgi:quinone-modifying oxidoreductase subunit QmoC